MFGKGNKGQSDRKSGIEEQQGRSELSNRAEPKYSHPKILLLDMGDEVEAALREAGYAVSVGSFGRPYKVPRCDELEPVIINGAFPRNFSEQEIIVIDLEPAEPLDGPEGEKHTSPGEDDWWASVLSAVI